MLTFRDTIVAIKARLDLQPPSDREIAKIGLDVSFENQAQHFAPIFPNPANCLRNSLFISSSTPAFFLNPFYVRSHSIRYI